MSYLQQHDFVIWEGWPSFTFYSGLQAAFTATYGYQREHPEQIAMAAVKHPDGMIYMVERPGRHGHVIACMGRLGKADRAGAGNTRDQGFVTTHGRYVNRIDGLVIAKAANQIIKKTQPERQLFSEDMW